MSAESEAGCDRDTFVSHLECSKTGQHYAAGEVHNLSAAGFPLLVRYHLNALRSALKKSDLTERTPGMWRYREFLPLTLGKNVVSLGEIATPLVALKNSVNGRGKGDLIVKDEGRLPTGSFKARGVALAVSMAKELGITRVAMPTNGNAGAALSAYATRAGMQSYIFCPEDTPEINICETALQGGITYRVNGLINDCGKIVGAGSAGWFDMSTLKEPYRIEGKKTMGLELCDQLGWSVPDVIFYPTGGGTGLIGMWKAFDELEALGWIGKKRPRMVAVQASGCAPIVKAFDEGAEHASEWAGAATIAAGIRVPACIGDFLILRALRESDGFAIAVSDERIDEARADVAANDGLLLCPEGAATYAAYKKSLQTGRIESSDNVVLFNCATGLKYPMPRAGITLDKNSEIDYTSLRRDHPESRS